MEIKNFIEPKNNTEIYLCNTYTVRLPNQKKIIDVFSKCMLFDNIEKAHEYKDNINKTSDSYHHLVNSQIYHVKTLYKYY